MRFAPAAGDRSGARRAAGGRDRPRGGGDAAQERARIAAGARGLRRASQAAFAAMRDAQRAGHGMTDTVLAGEQAAWRRGAQDVRTLFGRNGGLVAVRGAGRCAGRSAAGLRGGAPRRLLGRGFRGAVSQSAQPAVEAARATLGEAVARMRPDASLPRGRASAAHGDSVYPSRDPSGDATAGSAVTSAWLCRSRTVCIGGPRRHSASAEPADIRGRRGLLGASGPRDGEPGIVSAMVLITEDGHEVLWRGERRMTALERLGSYLANGQDLPPLALTNAKLRVIDGVAAWVAGHGHRRGAGAAGVPQGGARRGQRVRGADGPLRAGAPVRDRRHPSRRDDHGGRHRGAGRADARGVAEGDRARRARPRHRGRLRRDDPARPRAAWADHPLSRHLADLHRHGVRRGGGGGAADAARRAAGGACAGARAHHRGARRRPPQRADHHALARGRARGAQRARGGARGARRLHQRPQPARRKILRQRLRHRSRTRPS